MKEVTAETIKFDIFIGGDLGIARQVCREYTLDVGFCVTLESVSYIYTGGLEDGVRIGIINYPRFPATEENLFKKTRELADKLMISLCQESYSIVGPKETLWVSRRRADS